MLCSRQRVSSAAGLDVESSAALARELTREVMSQLERSSSDSSTTFSNWSCLVGMHTIAVCWLGLIELRQTASGESQWAPY